MLLFVSKICTIIGLVLGIVGTCFLAYGGLYGAGRESRIRNLKNSLQVALRIKEHGLASAEILKSQGHTDGYVSRARTEAEEFYQKESADIKEKLRAWQEDYPEKVSRLADKGIKLVVLSFTFQLIGTLCAW